MRLGDQVSNFSPLKAVTTARNFALKRLTGAAAHIMKVVDEGHFPDELGELKVLVILLNETITRAAADNYWKAYLEKTL
jgi:hypothetical protein